MTVAKVKRPEAVTDVQRAVGARIKWARELVVPNRAEFARIMGVDRSTLAKIEDGARPPSVFNVMDISHRLRVSADYILHGSLVGIDQELARELIRRHPELLTGNYTATVDGTHQKPTTQPGRKKA